MCTKEITVSSQNAAIETAELTSCGHIPQNGGHIKPNVTAISNGSLRTHVTGERSTQSALRRVVVSMKRWKTNQSNVRDGAFELVDYGYWGQGREGTQMQRVSLREIGDNSNSKREGR